MQFNFELIPFDILTQNNMKYELLEFQNELLDSPITTVELNILQRNSVTRLKEKREDNVVYHHSANEEDQHIRIIVFSLLVKIYKSYSLKNQDYLNKLKSLVYSSTLSPNITTNQGIQISQLFKYFAEKLNSLIICEQIEPTICTIMNNESFLEQIIFAAIKNKLSSKQLIKEAQIDTLTHFMKEEFDINVKIVDFANKDQEEGDNEIILVQISNHLHKVCVVQQERRSSSHSHQNYIVYNATPTSYKQESIKMDTSGNVNEFSPLCLPSKSQQQGNNIGKSIKIFDPLSSQKKRREEKEKRGGIFDMFCCCQ